MTIPDGGVGTVTAHYKYEGSDRILTIVNIGVAE